MFKQFNWEDFTDEFIMCNENHHCYIVWVGHTNGYGLQFISSTATMFLWMTENGDVFSTYDGIGLMSDEVNSDLIPKSLYTRDVVGEDGVICTASFKCKLLGWIAPYAGVEVRENVD